MITEKGGSSKKWVFYAKIEGKFLAKDRDTRLRSMKITFSRRYVVRNECPFPIYISQLFCETEAKRLLRPVNKKDRRILGETVHWNNKARPQMLTVSKNGDNWSGGFRIESPGNFSVMTGFNLCLFNVEVLDLFYFYVQKQCFKNFLEGKICFIIQIFLFLI